MTQHQRGDLRMAQGLLPFQYEAESSSGGVTALGGLPLYLDLIKASGLADAVRRHLRVAGDQGWLDVQMVVALLALNLAGGDCVEDLERLEGDSGFAAVVREVEGRLLGPAERRFLKRRWRRERRRSLPSPCSLLAWLGRFHSQEEEGKRQKGTAFIPAMTSQLAGLGLVNRALLGFLQSHRRERVATLDMDATLVESHKRQALYCYKKFKAYQPLNCWWAEQRVVLHSEFRDGNVPAGYEQLRVLKASRDEAAALGVEKVCLRSDAAGYQQDLLLFCGEGQDPRFGVIEFAVSADVTPEFRAAVRQVKEVEWQPLVRRDAEGDCTTTDQEWAEVCYVPSWVGYSKKRADYRFLVIREPLRQLDLGDTDQLPFATEEFAAKGRYKLFAVVTNRTLAWRRGDLVAARALRQERGSPFCHEGRSGRWPDAVGAVRGQCCLVGDHDPRPQPQCSDEAAGPRIGLAYQADEGGTLPPDQPAGARGAPCPPVDRARQCHGRDTDASAGGAANPPGPGSGTTGIDLHLNKHPQFLCRLVRCAARKPPRLPWHGWGDSLYDRRRRDGPAKHAIVTI